MKRFRFSCFKWSMFVLVVCLSLAISSVSFAKFVDRFRSFTEEGAQHGGDVVLYIAIPSSQIDPHQGTTMGMVFNDTMNGLLRLSPTMDGTYELDLAESWEQLDSMTYKFVLRKGVRFQNLPPVNGRELTSADVKYSIRRMAGLEIPPEPPPEKRKDWGRSLRFGSFKHNYCWTSLDSIETPDKYTVIIKMKQPFAPTLNYLASAWSKIVPREVVDAHGHFSKVSIGTGPFILKEKRQDAYMICERNPDYFKKPYPYLDRVKYLFIKEPSSAMAAFLAHKIEWLTPSSQHRDTVMKETPDSNFNEYTSTFQAVFRLPPWDSTKGELRKPWSDIRVRRAIIMAIDKDKVVSLGRQGYAVKNVGPVVNWPPYTLPQSENTEYNPEKARKLLAEAGYPNGFKAEILTYSTTSFQAVAQVIQDMLKGIGLDVELKILEAAQYFRKVYTYKYDMAVHAMTSPTDPDEVLSPYFGQVKHSTYYKWSDPVLWDMIEKQKHIMDPRERAAYIQDVQRRILDQAFTSFLYSDNYLVALPPYLHVKFRKNGFQAYMNERTWIDKAAQAKWRKD